MEHRWGDRIDCNIDVKLLALPASIGWGRLRNVSASGAYIQTPLALRTLSIVSLRPVSDRESGGPGNAIRAAVVRRDESGVGIEWVDSESTEVAAILRQAAGHRRARDGSIRTSVLSR
jgi:hypothetical protein